MVADLPPAVVCRVCGCPRLTSVHVRRTLRGTIRYRICRDCGTKHKTNEVIESVLRTARTRVAARLDKAVEVAVGFLTHTDEDGIGAGDLYVRVRRRVPGVTMTGFAFRLADDPRVTLGDDSRYRLVSPTA